MMPGWHQVVHCTVQLDTDWCTVHMYISRTGPSKVCVPQRSTKTHNFARIINFSKPEKDDDGHFKGHSELAKTGNILCH